MTDTIFVLKNAFPKSLCEKIVFFMNSREELYMPRGHQDEGNNVICDCINLSDYRKEDGSIRALDRDIADCLTKALRDVFAQIISTVGDANTLPFNTQISDTGYEVRRVRGPTRLHNDNVNASILGNKIRYRIASICICLSESGDEIVFPVQKRSIKYEPGMMVFFPNSWAYPHYTTYGELPNYRIQTWLANDVDPMKQT